MKQLSHWSDACYCDMTFSVFLPDQLSRGAAPPPVLYYLSGLTCSDENARTKAHFAQEAGKVGLAVVFPDTSPRGVDIPTQDDSSWDFGSGAGFYVDATTDSWSKHYNMYTYITKELPELIQVKRDKTMCAQLMLHIRLSSLLIPLVALLPDTQWEDMEP